MTKREVWDEQTQQWLRPGPYMPSGFDGFSLCDPEPAPTPYERRRRNQRRALLAAIAIALFGLGFAAFGVPR